MEFFHIFSLEDVFIAATGLMVASILRIYYDSYVENKKIKRFGQSLGIYNNLLENNPEGLLIISDNDSIIFANEQAIDILGTKMGALDIDHLKSLNIENEENGSNENLFKIIHTQNYLAHANINHNSIKTPITISVNHVKLSSQSNHYSYVVILCDMTNINDLRTGVTDLIK